MASDTNRGTTRLWNIAKLALALILVGFVLSNTSSRELSGVLRNVSVAWLIFSLVLYLAATLLKALQYHSLMRAELTYAQVLNTVIWQNAVSNFLASSAGIASYLASMRVENNVRMRRSVAVFILTKIGDLFALWLALLISSFIAWSDMGKLKNPVLGLLVGIGLVIAVFISTIAYRQKFVSLIRLFLERLKLLRFPWAQRGMDFLDQLAESSTQTDLSTRLRSVFGLSVIYLLVSTLWSFSNFMVFNLKVDLFEMIFVSVLIQLVSYIPIQIFGGLGVAESSSLFFWTALGVPAGTITPVLVGIRILYYLWNIIPLIYLPLYTAFSSRQARL